MAVTDLSREKVGAGAAQLLNTSAGQVFGFKVQKDYHCGTLDMSIDVQYGSTYSPLKRGKKKNGKIMLDYKIIMRDREYWTSIVAEFWLWSWQLILFDLQNWQKTGRHDKHGQAKDTYQDLMNNNVHSGAATHLRLLRLRVLLTGIDHG